MSLLPNPLGTGMMTPIGAPANPPTPAPTRFDQFSQGLLNNPLLGLGLGLLSGAQPGGTFASGAQQGLQNMMAMQRQQQAAQFNELRQQKMQAELAEIDRQKRMRETMAAQASGIFGTPAVMEETAGPRRPEFVGQPLMAETQAATGMYAEDPQMAGLFQTAYEADPVGVGQLLIEAQLEAAAGVDAPDKIRQVQTLMQDYGISQEEAMNRVYGHSLTDTMRNRMQFLNMTPEQRRLAALSQRRPGMFDTGTAGVDLDAWALGQYGGAPAAPAAAPAAPAVLPAPPAAPAPAAPGVQAPAMPAPTPPGVPAPAVETPEGPAIATTAGPAMTQPGTIQKDIIGEEVKRAEGKDVGARLVDYPSDMRVAEELKSSLTETRNQLTRLAGLTNYSTTGVASYLAGLPGTDANYWNNLKTTIESRMGLDKMMELKAASATGSTGFGALNAKELDLLVSNLGRLNQSTDPKQTQAIIVDIVRQLDGKLEAIDRGIQKQTDWYDANSWRLEESNRQGPAVLEWGDL